MRHLPQLILIATTLASVWLLMQVVHECGHALAGWLTAGEVRRVLLHPLMISRTDLGVNPHPLFVCWAGPMFGSVVPVLVWLAAKSLRWSVTFWLCFFAGFCLIANGAYLAIGSFDRIGDAGDLLNHGSPIGLLWLFGLTTIPAGLRLWHGLGPHFGLGRNGRPVSWRSASLSAALLIAIIVVEVSFSPR
jgi:Peptidase M50B-like